MGDASKDTEPAKHVEADFDSSTPLARTTVVVSVPQTLEIELVDSSVLRDYEVWSIQSSALFSILVGIAVAMIQSGWSSALGIFGFVFFVWFGFSLACAYKKRKQLKRNVTNIPFVPK